MVKGGSATTHSLCYETESSNRGHEEYEVIELIRSSQEKIVKQIITVDSLQRSANMNSPLLLSLHLQTSVEDWGGWPVPA